jgi:hypothetical protein
MSLSFHVVFIRLPVISDLAERLAKLVQSAYLAKTLPIFDLFTISYLNPPPTILICFDQRPLDKTTPRHDFIQWWAGENSPRSISVLPKGKIFVESCILV